MSERVQVKYNKQRRFRKAHKVKSVAETFDDLCRTFLGTSVHVSYNSQPINTRLSL